MSQKHYDVVVYSRTLTSQEHYDRSCARFLLSPDKSFR